MKITTKTGDQGTTHFRCEILKKSEPIFDIIGGLDEVQSLLGICYEYTEDQKELLKKHMHNLYKIMGDLYLNKPMNYLEDEVLQMEKIIEDVVMRNEKELNKFVLPIGSISIVHLHHARTVTRRFERLVEKYKDELKLPGEMIKYLNRLSDLLYALAVDINK